MTDHSDSANNMTATSLTNHFCCIICSYETDSPNPEDVGTVRGNTDRFKDTQFHLWKCPRCHSIHSTDQINLQEIYADYPLNRRRLDVYARGTLSNLLKRLLKAGVRKSDSVLDYGCGNGIFLQFLTERGFSHCRGYDPFVPAFASYPLDEFFDCVVANDVIEHVPDPRAAIQECISLLRPGGILYLGTADSNGVDMGDLEPHLMRLHQPFHRIIVNKDSLISLGVEAGLTVVSSYRRSYMDTLRPFSNYRFLDEFSKALGHSMDRSLDPSSASIVARRPYLLFYAFFGYFFPSAYEPAVILRKPA